MASSSSASPSPASSPTASPSPSRHGRPPHVAVTVVEPAAPAAAKPQDNSEAAALTSRSSYNTAAFILLAIALFVCAIGGIYVLLTALTHKQ